MTNLKGLSGDTHPPFRLGTKPSSVGELTLERVWNEAFNVPFTYPFMAKVQIKNEDWATPVPLILILKSVLFRKHAEVVQYR